MKTFMNLLFSAVFLVVSCKVRQGNESAQKTIHYTNQGNLINAFFYSKHTFERHTGKTLPYVHLVYCGDETTLEAFMEGLNNKKEPSDICRVWQYREMPIAKWDVEYMRLVQGKLSEADAKTEKEQVKMDMRKEARIDLSATNKEEKEKWFRAVAPLFEEPTGGSRSSTSGTGASAGKMQLTCDDHRSDDICYALDALKRSYEGSCGYNCTQTWKRRSDLHSIMTAWKKVIVEDNLAVPDAVSLRAWKTADGICGAINETVIVSQNRITTEYMRNHDAGMEVLKWLQGFHYSTLGCYYFNPPSGY